MMIERRKNDVYTVHGIFTTSKNTSAVFLATWFYNCEFDKIMTTYTVIFTVSWQKYTYQNSNLRVNLNPNFRESGLHITYIH